MVSLTRVILAQIVNRMMSLARMIVSQMIVALTGVTVTQIVALTGVTVTQIVALTGLIVPQKLGQMVVTVALAQTRVMMPVIRDVAKDVAEAK